MESGLDGRNNQHDIFRGVIGIKVSMESGLDGRNNEIILEFPGSGEFKSQWSPA